MNYEGTTRVMTAITTRASESASLANAHLKKEIQGFFSCACMCYERDWDREERVLREAAAALQYPRRYSTAGTVHGAAATRVGALGTPAAGLRPRPA